MSETKRLEGRPESYVIYGSTGIGNVACLNNNPYPVEVTVRRVAEKVVLSPWRVGHFSDKASSDWADIQRQLNAAGYATGQSVRVTIEPLD